MIRFSTEEKMMVLLYSPGTRPGLIAELDEMKKHLTPKEQRLKKLADSVIAKLYQITDEEFEHLDFFPNVE